MTSHPPTTDQQPPASLEAAALAIALTDRPAPRERSRCFAGGNLEAAIALFRRQFGDPPSERLEQAKRWRAETAEAGRRLLILGQPGYPPRLAEIAVPPIALEVAGEADLAAPAVAIVGSRRATPYGISVARRFAGELAEAGLVVVSGLARGVDAAAHRGALEAGGATIAVLGAALDCLYPPEHRDLARATAGSGAVLTEFPPGTRPLPHHFPRRNRIIAGLTLGTLVVEAAERSGSLATARHAVDSGREVFAVPGPIGSGTSAGCHALIRLGATLVTGASDVVEDLALSPGTARERPRPADKAHDEPGSGRAVPNLGAPAASLLETLRKQPSGVELDTLLEAIQLPVSVALAAVSELERRGFVERFPGDFLRVSG